jgi:hypothetical protein
VVTALDGRTRADPQSHIPMPRACTHCVRACIAMLHNTKVSLLPVLLMPLLSAVQAYMCTIANHPALQGSQELRVFLTYPTCLSKWGTGLLAPVIGSGNSSCDSSTTECASLLC